jgi:hypothetical protein
MTTLLGPSAIEIGEPGAFKNNDCGAWFEAFPDWHEVKKSNHAVVIKSVGRRMILCFKAVSFERVYLYQRNQLLDA